MFDLIWNGEVIDTFSTQEEAEKMKVEYNMAYGGGVYIVESDEGEEEYDDFEDDGDWMDGDALASAGFGTDEDYGYYGDDY